MSKSVVNIIGSGIGGLFSGALLSKHGFEVNVFEANSKVGGYATSWKRGKFLFDSSLHEINGFYPDDKKLRSFRLLDLFNRIRLIKVPSPYTSVFNNFEFKIPHDYKNLIEELIKAFPDEEKKINKVMETIKNVSIEACLFLNEKSKQEAFKNTPVKYRNIMKNLFNTVYGLVWKNIKTPRLRTIIAQLYLYYSDDIKKLNLLYFSSPTYAYLNQSYWISGTSSSLSNSLKDIIIENGGKVLTGNKVTKVLFENKKAVGVEINGGDKYYSDITICNGPLKQTIEKIIGYGNIPYRYRFNAFRTIPSTSIFSIYLGMDIDIKNIGFSEFCYIINELDDLKSIKVKKELTGYDKRPVVIVGYNLDDSLCPDGKTVVNISVVDNMSYWNKFKDNKEEYKNEKERIAHIILSRVDKIFPGFSHHIEVMEIATPLTMKKFSGNPEGAVYGTCQSVMLSNIFRFPNEIKNRNLYFSGAWVTPGGGLSGVIISAINSVEAILKNYGMKNKTDDYIYPLPEIDKIESGN